MRYMVGLFCLALASWIFLNARAKKARVLELAQIMPLPEKAKPENLTRLSLDDFCTVARSMILATAVFFSIALVFIYFYANVGRHLSLFDLGGLLAAVAAYCFSVVVMTTYRESDAYIHADKIGRDTSSLVN